MNSIHNLNLLKITLTQTSKKKTPNSSMWNPTKRLVSNFRLDLPYMSWFEGHVPIHSLSHLRWFVAVMKQKFSRTCSRMHFLCCDKTNKHQLCSSHQKKRLRSSLTKDSIGTCSSGLDSLPFETSPHRLVRYYWYILGCPWKLVTS